MWDLSKAGVQVIPVTGRSAGWAHLMLAQWPVPAVIAESGGLYLHKVRNAQGQLVTQSVFHQAAEIIASQRLALMQKCIALIEEFPGLSFASDNWLRQVDVAIDYCEEVPRVAWSTVQACIDRLRATGYQARHSSVHINAWQGSFDKGPMAMRYLTETLGLSSVEAHEHWIFIGDAPNDSSMFGMFPRSVAVANISEHLAALTDDTPKFITQASYGAGFIELAQKILRHRT